MVSTAVFLVTQRCPIACDFCAPECGPHKRDRIEPAWIRERIEQMLGWGMIRQVIFSGGEPLLLGKDLIDLVALCSRNDLLTRIVTNGFWARTEVVAGKWVADLKAAGLTEVNISVDDFHQAHIPLATIKHAVDALERAGIPVLLAHKRLRDSWMTVEVLEEAVGRELPVFERETGERHPVMVSGGWTVPIGQASDGATIERWMPDDENEAWKLPCQTVLRDVVISCRKELLFAIGDDLAGSIAAANSDFMTNWLRLEGPYGLMQFVRQKDPTIPFHPRYVQSCHLCNDLFMRADTRAVLAEHAEEYVPVIQAKRLGLELYRDQQKIG
ncbi:MAG: hypothetical protein CMJ64_18280 [Planctomycetaceae bacterium]|nr:hypothetical protein [Planctomycetaceae bacterium]